MSVYILSGARTASGTFLGEFKSTPAPRLGATAIEGAIKRANIDADKIDEVFMGNVISAGLGQAPARQAALFASLADSVPCTTVNKVCGSGMQTIILAAQSILSGDNKVAIAGGMENMSMAPHFWPGSRLGAKFGAVEVKDSMQWDGLHDVYSDQAMGNCAEECVKKFNFSREEMDEYAIESFKRAQSASEQGLFKNEIEPVLLKSRKGETVIDSDAGPFKANFEKMKTLRPAFSKDGAITAANASTINDGAAALVLAGEEYKDQAKFKILSHASHAQAPTWFSTAPVEAMKKSLKKSGLSWSDIGLYEINEAFAAVSMAAIKELELDHAKVNVFGGAVSLGHPIGCSGSRIVVTLMNAMQVKNVKYGMASICIGGGEALSLVIEKL